jgi:peptide-methionine (S)-S-oxide reductase
MKVAIGRLDQTADVFKIHELFVTGDDDESDQYRHGFYHHNDEQKLLAEAFLKEESRFRIELLPATTFYDAEDYHQHYLLKGGQSARKGAKIPFDVLANGSTMLMLGEHLSVTTVVLDR